MKRKCIIKTLKEEVARSTPLQNNQLCALHQFDEVSENDSRIKVRRVYIPHSDYCVGWIHDADIKYCMKCGMEFNIIKRKHHCRSCGNIFCGACSPYTARFPVLVQEETSSRVCLNCFGLRHNGMPLYKVK